MKTSSIMRWVCISTIPALTLITLWQGIYFLAHLTMAIISGLIFESIVLRLRHKSILPALKDGSVLITAVLLTICIPASAPLWITIIGMFFAIVIAKQLFGGLGHNIFNPAMVGYAVLLVSFPQYLTQWHFIDAVSMATPLDLQKTNQYIQGMSWEPFQAIVWINLAWLIGGLVLLYKKIIDYRIPMAMLMMVVVTSLIIEQFTQDALPLTWQLLFGSTIVGALYIATDPVTASATTIGRWIYGALIGVLLITIRQFSAYPDGLAFAILLANLCVPLMDHLTARVKLS